MKKQKWKKLLLAVTVLVLLLAVYLVLQKWNQTQEEAAETETAAEQVMSAASDEIEKLTIQRESGSLAFVKSEDGWRYEEDADFPLNQDILDGAAANLEEVTANRRLEDAAELSEYGLDSPAVQVTVKKTDGTEVTLQIGNRNSSTGDYYAKLAGEDTVYTIGSTAASAFDKELYDFAVEDSFPEIPAANVDGMKIEKEESTLSFAYENSSWTVSDGSREEEADSAKLSELTAAAGSLTYDSYVDYRAEDLAKYGLDAPTARITIAYTTTETAESSRQDESNAGDASEKTGTATEDASEKTGTATEAASEKAGTATEDTVEGTEINPAGTNEETEAKTETEAETVEVSHQVILEVGSLVPAEASSDAESGNAAEEASDETETAERFYYVKLADSGAVHTISENSLSTWLDVAYTDCLDSYVSDIPVTGMNSLKVTYGGQTYELTCREESTTETDEDGEETVSTEYTYYVDGAEADTTLFTRFCNAAAAIQTQSRLEAEPENPGEAVLILEYEKTDSSTRKAEYIPYENGVYLVKVSDKQPGLVSKLDVEGLIEKFEELTGMHEN